MLQLSVRGRAVAGASLAVRSGAPTEPPSVCGHEQRTGGQSWSNQETWGTGLGKEVELQQKAMGLWLWFQSQKSNGSCQWFSRFGTGKWRVFHFAPDDGSYLPGTYLRAVKLNVTWVMDFSGS